MADPKENANEALLLLAIEHRIGLERVSTATVRKILALIRRVEQDVLGRIAVATALNRSTLGLEQFLAELRDIYADGYQRVSREISGDLTEIAVYEAQWQARSLGATLSIEANIPAVNQLVAAVNARPFQGKLLQGWLDDLPEGAAKRVQEAIRIGYVEGESADKIIKRIRGTKAAKYKDGVMQISRRGAETMVRTAISHTASVAQEATYEANAAVITGIEWVSTLDSRTTPICRSRDGKVFKVGQGPRPPAHLNCRSTTIARIKGSTPPPRLTYGEWLKKQNAARQDDILGKTRGKLYREGGLEVDRFTNPAGKQWTLAELKKREASAFAAAGLN